MTEKRRLQDVIPPRETPPRPRREAPVETRPQQEHGGGERKPPRPRSPKRGRGRWGAWLGAILALVILFFGFSFLFADSRVSVHPKNREVTVDGAFEAFRSPATGQLGFEIMSIEEEASREIKASGEEQVEEKASGVIVVYNNHSSAQQRLIKDTRFETPDGLIYRIPEAIVVPGQRTVDGETVPGSIEVTVYADQPGETYNIGLTDFTVPGFSGSPRFDTFYARSKTPMTGGFDGIRKSVSEDDRQQAISEMRAELRGKLLNAAHAQKPAGFLLYDDAVFIAYASGTEAGGSGDTATLREKATLYGVLISEAQFASLLAENTVVGYEGSSVRIVDSNALSFSILEKEAVRPKEDDSIAFSVRGRAHLVWTFDMSRLQGDLAGVSKDALPTILSGYPSIEQAEAILRPFWRGEFPERPEDINIVEKLDA